MPAADLVPMEWPSEWRTPALLKLLDSAPVNCLLLDKGAPPDLRAAAQARQLECPPPLPWRSWKEIDWNQKTGPACISDGVWPELSMKGNDAAQDSTGSGPTGAPWLDANGWLIRLARARAAGRDVWIRSDPPEKSQNLAADNYLLAQSEAAAFGAIRPLWIAPALASQIAAGNASAEAMFKRLLANISWHRQRREWSQWPVVARLVIASDFAGPNEFTASETLLLAARRNLSFQPVESARLNSAALQNRRALLYLDTQPLPAAAAAAVQPFVESGGLLLCLKASAAALKGLKPLAETHPRFTLHACGKGRVAVCNGEWDDPYMLALDTHLLMSRRYDAVRLFNSGSLSYLHTASADSNRWVVQLLNYSRHGAAHQVSLQTWRKVQSARFHSPELAQVQPLTIQRDPGQQEVYLPTFKVYGAVELELTPNA
jgi:hypothetical protein